MVTTQNPAWVSEMADHLVREITEQMCGLRLKRAMPPGDDPQNKDWATIDAQVEGDYKIELLFQAEPELLAQLTENMLGQPPDEEEIQDYAAEYFNVLCGRFLSELIHLTGVSVQLFPIRYKVPSKDRPLAERGALCTVHFVSDDQHQASFSWTAAPIEDMLRRKLNGNTSHHGGG